jgi:putative acetyltransferase
MADVVIRPMRPDDALEWHAMRTQPSSVRGTLQLPTLSLEDVRTQAVSSPTDHKLVAEVDGKLAGSINLHVGTGAQRHVGYIGMNVGEGYQGQGIGTQLMAAILDLADNWLMLERVELGVYPDNEPAVRLYRSAGFAEEGRSPQYAMRDGSLTDILHMGRLRSGAAAPAESSLAPEQAAGPEAHLPAITPTIRGVRPEDYRAIHALLLQPSVLRGTGRVPSLQEDELRKEICGLPRTQHMLVAESERQLLGFAHLVQFGGRRSHSGAIRTFAVHPAWQHRGVGTTLMQAVVDLSEKWLGLRRLEMTVPAPAAAGIQLCRDFGFAQEAAFRGAWAWNGRYADAVLMGRTH